jgi:hypothetical protein
MERTGEARHHSARPYLDKMTQRIAFGRRGGPFLRAVPAGSSTGQIHALMVESRQRRQWHGRCHVQWRVGGGRFLELPLEGMKLCLTDNA